MKCEGNLISKIQRERWIFAQYIQTLPVHTTLLFMGIVALLF